MNDTVTFVDVSVIIPSYNRAKQLVSAVESVINQKTDVPIEIIIVDDGSTDDTEDKVAQLIKEATTELRSIKYLKQPNLGVSCARNFGISMAQSEWIALLDSDDIWHENKLQSQIKGLLKSKLKIVHSAEVWIDNGVFRNQKNKHKKLGGWLFQACLPLCLISPSTVMIHRTVFDNVGLFDESLPVCEDYDMWLRIAANYEMAYIDTPLVTKYAGHEGQLSKTHWGMDQYRIKSLENNFERLVNLSIDDKIALLNVLLKKIEIFSKGLKRREKLSQWQVYNNKYVKYQACLNQLLEL